MTPAFRRMRRSWFAQASVFPPSERLAKALGRMRRRRAIPAACETSRTVLLRFALAHAQKRGIQPELAERKKGEVEISRRRDRMTARARIARAYHPAKRHQRARDVLHAFYDRLVA